VWREVLSEQSALVGERGGKSKKKSYCGPEGWCWKQRGERKSRIEGKLGLKTSGIDEVDERR